MEMNRNHERFAMAVAIHSHHLFRPIQYDRHLRLRPGRRHFDGYLRLRVPGAFKAGFRHQKENLLKVLLVNFIPGIFSIPASFYLNSAEYPYVCAYTTFVYVITAGVFVFIEVFCRTGAAPPANENVPLDNAVPAWNL